MPATVTINAPATQTTGDAPVTPPVTPPAETYEDRFFKALAADDVTKAATKAAADAPPVVPPVTPPVTPKPADTPVPDDDVPVSIKSTKAADDWRKIKQKHADEMSAVREQLKQAEAKAVNTTLQTDYDTLRKENVEMSDALKRLDVERHPRFQKYYDARMATALEEAKTIAGDLWSKLQPIMAMPEGQMKSEQLGDALSEMGEVQRMEFVSAVREAKRVSAERQQAITNSKEEWSKLQETMKQEQASVARETSAAFENESAEAMKSIAAFQRREGDAEWNSGVDERVRIANHIYNGSMSTRETARAALWAAAAPALLSQMNTLMEQNKTLAAQIASMKASNPNGTGSDVPPPEAKGTGDYMTDAAARAARALS